jgi:transposase InsO family protein
MKAHAFVEAEQVAGNSVNNACCLLEVSRSAFYARCDATPSKRSVSDTELLKQIRTIHDESKGSYGAPRIHKELGHRQVRCGKHRVERLMRLAGLEGRCKKRFKKTTVIDPAAERAKDLIQRHFGPCEELNRRYVGDITYISTWQGWAYLATVIDLASRKVVGWAIADHMRTELVEEALSNAFLSRRPPAGVIFHSDRGSQYTSRDFAELAKANGVELSIGRTGECWDNAVAESFFATIKRELIETRPWPTRAGLKRAVFEWIEGWYNTKRLHSSLGYLSPAVYEARCSTAVSQAA